MSALLSVEIRRIASRRAVLAAAALLLLGMVIGGSVLFARSHRVDPAQLRAMTQRAEAQRQEEVLACARGERGIRAEDVPPGSSLGEFCEQIIQAPPVGGFTFPLVHYRDLAEGFSGLFIALVMILAASFIGAEWHAGTVTTQLTWEPRRNRVLAAKVMATVVFAFVFFVLAEVLLLGILAPSAVFHGTTEGVTLGWWRGAVGVVLRGGAAAALAAAIAFSAASIARNTAAAVGAVFVYMALLEPLIRSARPKWQPWYLYDNLSTFISGHRVDFSQYGRSMMGAGLVISFYTLGFVLLALAAFRQRDVT